MRAVGFVLLAALLPGCASSSGVFLVGPDIYRVTTTAITSFGGAGTARRSGVDSANAYCAKMGKAALVTDAQSNSQFTQGDSDITFKCQ